MRVGVVEKRIELEGDTEGEAEGVREITCGDGDSLNDRVDVAVRSGMEEGERE